ncbi:lasso peptide biosynthesis PqqD family chaperone [Dactylosporangium sp. AC04546]|uniref:lasso peptide biosynthesis PqqD family chaperone n=1 Tax=Dactylosporangium sp. AC04546 TaxID=2862460 RepID=UPI001EDD2FE8|nr:lasso peptide biosynthesis PqqD family chaperone [Dactylosporangium sp. AC04546]WVK78705.1 lasso peptide biosynthesis PqqD family chaperone [Dactylosporangium sp. AC04546]
MALVLAPDVTTTAVEDGLVLLDQRSGRYWQLNGSGALTLRRLLDGAAPADVADELAGDAGEVRARALGDVETLVAALCRAGLLRDEGGAAA